ncbi:MAG: SDR family oxidoreductase, partial [Myxococcota bacterium]
MGRADAAQITRVIDTNLTGAIQVVNAFMPRMRQHSTIVLVNSILGQIPIMGSSVYCATKAGLRYFGEAVELEVQRSGRDIRLHSLYPAYVETPFLDHVRDTQGNLMLKPISPREAVAQLKHLFQNNGASSRRQADGFVLSRDRAIAAVYRYLPSAFKKIVTAL